MLQWASLVPGSLKYDPDVLVRWPYPDGLQHDEVKRGWGLATAMLGLTWTEKKRKLPSADAVMHRSVYERFDLRAAPIYDEMRAYRPDTLASHSDFARYYLTGAPFPADSTKAATAMADDPKAIRNGF
jgi:hypothetical protein